MKSRKLGKVKFGAAEIPRDWGRTHGAIDNAGPFWDVQWLRRFGSDDLEDDQPIRVDFESAEDPRLVPLLGRCSPSVTQCSFSPFPCAGIDYAKRLSHFGSNVFRVERYKLPNAPVEGQWQYDQKCVAELGTRTTLVQHFWSHGNIPGTTEFPPPSMSFMSNRLSFSHIVIALASLD